MADKGCPCPRRMCAFAIPALRRRIFELPSILARCRDSPFVLSPSSARSSIPPPRREPAGNPFQANHKRETKSQQAATYLGWRPGFVGKGECCVSGMRSTMFRLFLYQGLSREMVWTHTAPGIQYSFSTDGLNWNVFSRCIQSFT